jgi:hypothetical protein
VEMIRQVTSRERYRGHGPQPGDDHAEDNSCHRAGRTP